LLRLAEVEQSDDGVYDLLIEHGSGPGQANRRGGVGDDAFAATGEAELLAGGGLHADARDVDAGDAGDRRAHGVAMRTDPRRFGDDVEIEMRDHAAARLDPLDGEG